mmetsp:Transcript_17982/g.29773  ORF Transcript_17982/g.29773 Transcript_17982/m.29773 type:complete len:261 (-) Transcript_17982:24-806(-)
MGISIGGKDLKDTVINGKKSNIESSSTQVKDENIGFSASLVHTVGNGGGGWLVDDTLDLHTGDSSGILGGLTLGIVKVSRNGNNSVLDFLAQKGLGSSLHLLQDHGRDFLRSKLDSLATLFDLNHWLVLVGDNFVRDKLLVGLNRLVRVLTSDKTLDIKDSVLWVDRGLVLGSITNETITRVHKGNVGRSNTVTLVVGNDFDTTVLEDTDARVGGSKIDSDDCSHGFLLGKDSRRHGKCQSSEGKFSKDHCINWCWGKEK